MTMLDSNQIQGNISMQDFYQGFGLVDYPFNVYTAENESKYAPKIFVHPLNYDSIKDSFDGNRSIIIRGNRGTGKTALINDLQQTSTTNDYLVCAIDDYSSLNIQPNNSEYYKLLITNIVTTLFYRLFDEPKRLKKVNREDRLLLSYLLSEYTNQITKAELTRKIEAIQLSGAQRFFKNRINFFRAVFNYGLTAALNILNDVIRNYYAGLPPVEKSTIREIAPEFNISAETDFNSASASYDMLLQTCIVVQKLGYNRIVIFFDKFDEDSRMENNAEIISEFVSPLLTDNKLLESSNFQIVISIWEVPFGRILSTVRTQKHYCPVLSWPVSKLVDALNQRISVFSDNKILSYTDMFALDVDEESTKEIFYLSNGNPRDLWHIFDHIFQAQYALDPTSKKLTTEAIKRGLNDFVLNFNFYEYYPKKPKAKANTMDIYSYIKHLLKLPEERFTKNQLNELAGTGNSTSNYVVGMENIGLVINTKEKLHGGILYCINDPKVVYAIKNGLDISRR